MHKLHNTTQKHTYTHTHKTYAQNPENWIKKENVVEYLK